MQPTTTYSNLAIYYSILTMSQFLKNCDATNKLFDEPEIQFMINPEGKKSLVYKFPLINERALARNLFKVFMKTGKIIESTFVTQSFYALVVFNK